MRITTIGTAHGDYNVTVSWPGLPSESFSATKLYSSLLFRPNPTPRKKPKTYIMPTDYQTNIQVVVAEGKLSGSGAWPIDSNHGYRPARYHVTGHAALWSEQAAWLLTREISPNNVRMKVRNNAKDEVFDVAMVLAEMQSTVDTAGACIDRIFRSMLTVARRKPFDFDYLMHGRKREVWHRGKKKYVVGKGRLVGAERFNREVAGTFLEWKYGIMPSVLDLQGAIKGLDLNEKGSFWDNPPLLVARATDTNTFTATVPFHGAIGPGNSTGTGILEVQQKLSARLDYKVTGEGLRGLNRYGIGIGTIATVAWDKTPFSFVVDMAFPVASLIKSWTALSGCTVLGYCESHLTEIANAKISFTGHVLSAKWSGTADVVGSYKRLRRQAFPYMPMPMPFVRNPIKLGNFQTILALFTQLRAVRAPTK